MAVVLDEGGHAHDTILDDSVSSHYDKNGW